MSKKATISVHAFHLALVDKGFAGGHGAYLAFYFSVGVHRFSFFVYLCSVVSKDPVI